MKSVLFILRLPPPINGEAMVGKLVQESCLINKAFEARFINLATAHTLKQVGKMSFVKIIHLSKVMASVIKCLCINKYDLCYMTITAAGPGFYKDLLVVSILKLFRKKIIFHFHNKGVALSGKKTINNYLYRYAFKNTKCILLSPLLYEDIKKYVNENNVFFCPNGLPKIDPGQINNCGHSHKNNTCSLLFLSNMLNEKGVFVLLNACKILKTKGLSFACHFVGPWVDITKEEFDAYILQNNLNNSVFSHGPKYGTDKSIYFNKADIFVFPTYYHYETFGLVNLEAMQHGLPVVSTFEGGIPDVVLDGISGFLVPQEDEKMLAAKLELLIENPELRFKMGIAGKERFESLFTYSHFEKNFTNILLKAVDEN